MQVTIQLLILGIIQDRKNCCSLLDYYYFILTFGLLI